MLDFSQPQNLFFTSDVIELSLILALMVIEMVLKGYSMWKSAQAHHKWWFIVLLVFNTLGILPIVYLLFFQKTPIVKWGKNK